MLSKMFFNNFNLKNLALEEQILDREIAATLVRIRDKLKKLNHEVIPKKISQASSKKEKMEYETLSAALDVGEDLINQVQKNSKKTLD